MTVWKHEKFELQFNVIQIYFRPDIWSREFRQEFFDLILRSWDLIF